MAPSLAEYYLSDLSQYCEDTYLNKTQIEQTVSIGDYYLYIDYNKEVYLEVDDDKTDSYETGSFW